MSGFMSKALSCIINHPYCNALELRNGLALDSLPTKMPIQSSNSRECSIVMKKDGYKIIGKRFQAYTVKKRKKDTVKVSTPLDNC